MSHTYEKQKQPDYGAGLDAPPPYYDAVPNAAPGWNPADDAPSYNHAVAGGPSSPRTLVAATAKFPPAFNCYLQWAFTRTCHLGPSADEKLFAASLRTSLRNQREVIVFDGPSDKDPVLIKMEKKWTSTMYKPTKITMPARPDRGERVPYETEMTGIPFSFDQSTARTFMVEVGGKGTDMEPRAEEFQWRYSHAEEVKQLAGWGYGWKLVWLSGSRSEGAGGRRGERDRGFTSDGHEVVAVLASGKGMTQAAKFAFVGTGLTGILGERWEATAVATAIWTWYANVEGES